MQQFLKDTIQSDTYDKTRVPGFNMNITGPCFDGIARALAKFYAVQPPPAAAARPRQQNAQGGGGGGGAADTAAAAAAGGGAAGRGADDDAEAARLERRAKHVIYPALRSCLLRPIFYL